MSAAASELQIEEIGKLPLDTTFAEFRSMRMKTRVASEYATRLPAGYIPARSGYGPTLREGEVKNRSSS